MGVQSLHGLLTHVLREIEINLIADLVIDFSSNASNLFPFLSSEDNMTVLGLWVEHDASHRVVLAFDRNHELFTFLFVYRQDIEEVPQRLPLSIGVRLDCPGMRVKIQILCL